MRARLLDATVECLFDLGYARTTTTVICERAGVSRGAQLHHFPTKASLVTTAVEHLFERRRTELLESAAELPVQADRSQQVIDLLWQIVSGSTFYAWLELVVAARTEPELHESLQALSARMSESTLEAFGQIFPAVAPNDFRVILSFVFSVLEGLALRKIIDHRDPDVDGVLGVLKSLTELVDLSDPSSVLQLPADPPPPTSSTE